VPGKKHCTTCQSGCNKCPLLLLLLLLLMLMMMLRVIQLAGHEELHTPVSRCCLGAAS
jgi:hypothetical protein